MIFQEKIKPNRKKNLSSKIIVDEYDHLIKNSKMQPNYQSFMQVPISPPFMHKNTKFVSLNQQSSESQYSMHQQNQNQKQCYQCGQNFSTRVYDSHVKICEKGQKNWVKQQNPLNFNKKDEYNLLSMNQSMDPQNKLITGRNKMSKKINVNELNQANKKVQLVKTNSKKSIHSLQKNCVKKPSSSTRNKVELKGHQNLKQKILNKLEGTRNKNFQQKQEYLKSGISSSLKRNNTSNSKPKSINKNLNAKQYCKYSTINSSSMQNKKLQNHQVNTDFNRSQIMNYQNGKKKQKSQFPSKNNIKQEKKPTLKKKNINFNNSFVNTQQFIRQKEKEKTAKFNENKNFTANNSYLTKKSQYQKNYPLKNKQFIREEIRKQGVFRRQSSSSASKRKFNREHQKQRIEQKSPLGSQDVNDEYYFFQNHPSSVPSHVIKRQQEPLLRHQHFGRNEIYETNSSNIIRNKLGINKNLVQAKQTVHGKRPDTRNYKITTQQQIPEQNKRNEIFLRSQAFQKQGFHRRTNSSRQNNNKKYERQIHQNFFPESLHRQKIQQGLNRNYKNEEILPQRSNNIENRHRPQNPMGQQRQTQRRQNINRTQNRPQTRITNQRMNSQNDQRLTSQNQNTRTQARNNVEENQSRRQHNRRQNPQNRRQNENQRSNRRSNQNRRRQQNRNGTGGQRMRNQTLNFISNTLNEQFDVMNEHFNLLNNIFSNFNNYVNVNITTSNNDDNTTTYVFQNNRRRNRRQNQSNQQSNSQNSQSISSFSSDFSQDQSNQTDYDQDEYYYEEQEQQNPGMTEHQINSIPTLKYNKSKHGSNQCTICLVELNQNESFKKLYCHHVFHPQCIDEWLKRKNACPVCRDQMGVRS